LSSSLSPPGIPKYLCSIIPQQKLFRWDEIEKLGELERLHLVLKVVQCEELMRELESERARGRNYYPVRAVWNLILAGVVVEPV
jgi:hypothetical protein